MTYVYIIGSDTFVKIGLSNNPERRLTAMQTGNPHDLNLLLKIPCGTREEAIKKEKEFHLLFSAWHHRGEWFYAECMGRALSIPVHVRRQQRKAEKEAKRCRISSKNGVNDEYFKEKNRIKSEKRQARRKKYLERQTLSK